MDQSAPKQVLRDVVQLTVPYMEWIPYQVHGYFYQLMTCAAQPSATDIDLTKAIPNATKGTVEATPTGRIVPRPPTPSTHQQKRLCASVFLSPLPLIMNGFKSVLSFSEGKIMC